MTTTQTLEVSLANKPTFVEVEKMVDRLGYKYSQALEDQNIKMKSKHN